MTQKWHKTWRLKMNKMMKQNQAIAITKGEKTRKASILNKVYRNLDKGTLLDGISRTY